MMAHSLSDMENYFSELEDFITLSDNDKVHLFHSSMLEILILKVNLGFLLSGLLAVLSIERSPRIRTPL